MPSRRSQNRPPIFVLRSYLPASRHERSRARQFILRALRSCRGHIQRRIGDPNRFHWVSWYVFSPHSMILANNICSYHFHTSGTDPQPHWTVRAVRNGVAVHTLHVFDDGRDADSFGNGGAHRRRRRMHRRSYVRL
jgi:hypothetical protein